VLETNSSSIPQLSVAANSQLSTRGVVPLWYYQAMTATMVLATILQSFAISLGVGASTLAILNFFAAIADGTIDETERRMMGIVYVVLRIAMVLILVTTIFLVLHQYIMALPMLWNGFLVGQLIALTMLFINALLMTAHVVPTTLGPAIQAGSWYTLGVLNALAVLGLTEFAIPTFTFAYFTTLALAVAIVNLAIEIQKAKRRNGSN
jgi:hypothetical protein